MEESKNLPVEEVLQLIFLGQQRVTTGCLNEAPKEQMDLIVKKLNCYSLLVLKVAIEEEVKKRMELFKKA